jgi:hypothetical protein
VDRIPKVPSQWRPTEVRRLELEFKGEDGLARRLMGVFDGAKTAILLIGCYHKGGNYTPIDALETAAKRASLHFRKEARVRERTIKEDI